MGAGGSASEAILFIGSIIVATTLVGAISLVTNNLSGDLRERGSGLSKELRSDIVLINDPLNVSTGPLILYAKNTGQVSLFSELTDVVVDGVFSTSLAYDVLSSTDDVTWKSGQVLKITASNPTIGVGDHRVRAIAETGAEAVLEFHKAS